MIGPTRILSCLGVVLLIATGLSASTAWAQNYANPIGATVYFSDGDCGTPAARIDPCSLSDAVRDATDGGSNGNTVFVELANVGATVTFQEDLEGAAQIDADMTLDTFFGATDGGIPGFIAIDGDIVVDGGATMTIVEGVEVRLIAQPGRLELHDTAVIDGDGFIAFTATGVDHLILLGEASGGCVGATPNTAHINNMRIDKPIGEVEVVNECPIDDASDLLITNRLQLDDGTLNMNDNNLRIASLSEASGGDNPGVEIAGSGDIMGTGRFFIEVEEPAEVPEGLAKTAGPVGFANTSDGCFEIEGAGDLMIAFDKTTNAGVCIDLDEIGVGGFSFNRAGTLFVREAIQLNGSFLNESLTGDVPGSGARTEFWKLQTITTNLEIFGPGEEVLDPFFDFISAPAPGHCETGGQAVGNESGIYFFTNVTIQGDLVMTDTDDLATTPCVEGVWFLGDPDPDDPVAALKAGSPATHQSFSTIEGDFTSWGSVGVFLDSPGGGFVHNVAFEGDFLFGSPSPTFTLVDPADAFPRGDLCSPYTNEADGNKVLFTGGEDQDLLYPGTLAIESVQINMSNTNDDVEIHEDSGVFTINTTVELLRGGFNTNGLFDAGGTATIVVNRDDDGTGYLEAGNAVRAYVGDDADEVPRKVKYTGNKPHFTSDEIPGDRDGSTPGAEIFLPFLEIFSSEDNAVITLAKDFTIGPESKTGGELTMTRGILDVGSSDLRLSNELLIAIGDGDIQDPEIIGNRGGFDFPTQWIPNAPPDGFGRDFRVGEDGIDVLYFGTTNHTVGLEMPPSDTDVANRDEDADVLRDVTINPGCADDITISLREEDNASRFNGDLIVGAEEPGQEGAPGTNVGTLDIKGNILEVNASHNAGRGFNNGVVEVHNGADLTDSTDELLDAGHARLGELAMTVDAAMAEYRRTRTEEARGEMNVKTAALRTAQQGISKTAAHAGVLRFIGGDRTDVWVETSESRLRFDFPAMEIDKVDVEPGDDSRVTFDAQGVLSDAMGGVPANNPDIIGTSHFTLIDAEIGSTVLEDGDAGGVELLDGLDIFDVGGSYEQFDGEFLMAGVSSVGPPPVKPFVQTVMVGFRFDPGDMIIEDGEFFAGNAIGAVDGGNVVVFGDFCLGCTPPATSDAASKRAAAPSDALFSLKMNGTHTIVGDFTVGPDTDPNETPEIDKRNRYFLGGECGVLPDKGGLFTNGDYHFEGTGDRFDDTVWSQQEQGLHGNVFFTGAVEQTVWHRQDEDAFFCDVIMASRSDDNDGIALLNNAWQNDEGTLKLEHGIIDTDGGSWDWIMLNTGFETDLVGRNNASVGEGVVDLGSGDSYVDSSIIRSVLLATGSSGGYLFPVGTEKNGFDFFRALILQFSDHLGLLSNARVTYRQDLTSTDVDFTPFDVLGSEGPLRLDGVANLFWQLDIDLLPIFDPTLRLELEGLAPIFDILKLRILQWDCDGTHPRLAGFFDITGGSSAAVTAFINGVPNVTQVGVNLQACQLFGIATNLAANPISDARRYVATTGTDAGDCTHSLDPCATLAYAIGQANNGDIIDLAVGTYNEAGLVIEKNLIIQGQGVVVQ